MSVEGWAEAQLGDFVSLQRGHDLPDHQRRPGVVPILGSFGITGYHDEAKVKGPGLTVGRSGASFGVVSFTRTDYWPLNTALFVTDFHGNDERFAYYLLKCIDFKKYDSGSAQPSLNRNYIRSIRVRVPPFHEQRAIARILGTLDDKIQLNRRMNETLEAMARAIFKSWFVDFDPVRAKAEGRQSFGMNAETAALFPESFQDSPLGKVPAGWRVGKIVDLVSLSRKTINPGDFPAEQFDLYSIPAFDEGRQPLQEKGNEIKSNKFTVPQIAVLLSKLNPRIPRVWFPIPGGNRRLIASTEFLVAIPLSGYSREYVFSVFNSESFLDVFTTLVTGTSGSHQRVKPEFLLSMDVVIPPKECVLAFSRTVRPMYELVAVNLGQLQTLAAIRDALLPKLISGEIRVKRAEKLVAPTR